MAGGLASGFSMFGGAVTDLFTAKADRAIAQGDWDAAGQYGYAANIAETNKELTKLSTDVKLTQTSRKINQTIGAEEATLGAANVGPGGSGGDLLRSSIQQGALAKQLVSTQGALDENAFEQQAAGYRAMRSSSQAASNAADEAAKGANIGTLFKVGAGLLSFA